MTTSCCFFYDHKISVNEINTELFSLCDSTHQNTPVGSEAQNWLSFLCSNIKIDLFRKCYSISSLWVQKLLKSDFAFSRYGNFIDKIIIDLWKLTLEKVLKSLGIWEKFVQYSNSKKSIFTCTTGIKYKLHYNCFIVGK